MTRRSDRAAMARIVAEAEARRPGSVHGLEMRAEAMERAFANIDALYAGKPPEPPPRPTAPLEPEYRSKLEARFEHEWLSRYGGAGMYAYEPIRLRLPEIGGRRATYTPDFVCWDASRMTAYEVKGGHRWRRQGIAVLRAAAAVWIPRGWAFYLAEFKDGEWKISEVTV